MARSRSWLVLLLFAAFIPSCGGANADDHLQKATEYVELGRIAEAVIEYRAALQLEPNRGDIRLKLADAYLRQRDLAGAYRESLRAADLLPNDASAQFKAGTLLLLTNEFEDAKTRAKKGLALDPKSSDGQILLGNALAGLRDLDSAITEYQEAIAIDPGAFTAYDNIGILQWARGERDEAEASFRKAIEAAPKSSEARMALANFLWSTGRLAEAEQTLKAALAIEPTHVGANRALGFFYIASNRAEEAEQFFQVLARDAKSAAAKMAIADYYLMIRKPDEARKALRQLAERDPTAFAVATTRLAALDVAHGDRAQASAKLREVLEKHPHEAPARLLHARLLLVDGKRDEALAEANKIVTDLPNSAIAGAAYTFIGGIHATADRRADAIKAYQEVLRLQARPLVAHLALAALYLSDGAVEKAATAVRDALAAAPGNLVARTLSVRVARAQQNTTRARDELNALHKEHPTAPIVLKLVAEQQLADGNADAARGTYAKLAQVAPNDLDAFAGLVRIELSQRNTEGVIRALDARLKAGQPTVALLMFAAQAYDAAGRTEKSEELLRQAIDLDPANLPAYELLGRWYFRQKRLDEAEEQFAKIVERNPNSVSAQTMLGMLLEAQGRQPAAEARYQETLRIDRRAAVAANNLAWIYVTSNRNLDEALKLAQLAHQQLPDNPNVNDTLGWIYFRKNIPAIAVRHLELSVEKKADDPTSQYHLGMAYAQLGELEKAKKSLERALALNDKFEGALEARQKLSQLGG